MVDFIRKATKKSLLAMLRKADKITPKLLARLFEGVLFKDEYETFSGAGGIDHGALGGLADDDHTQYVRHNLSTAANDFLVGSGSNTFVKKTLAETGAILEADLDHGSIQGLSGDDHSQYLLADGTRELTDDWDAGSFQITASEFNTSGDVDASGEIIGNALDIATDADVGGTLTVNTIDEHTLNSGVTIEGVLIKDYACTFPSGLTAEDDVDLQGNVDVGGFLDVVGEVIARDYLKTDEIREYTATAGVTIDGLLIKDSNIPSVNYAFVTANDGATSVTAAELEELSDGSNTALHVHDYSQLVCLTTYVDVKARLAEYNIHGGLDSIDTAHDLSAGNLVTTVGTGKVMLVINAGGDLVGDIVVTGTTVDRNTGTETGADTDTLTIDSATTDNSDTDASGNTRHAFTGAYLTSKWFKGSITISSADTAVTDMDTYQVSFEQFNDSSSITLNSFDMNAKATNASAWMYAYLYTLVVTGDKCDIARFSTLDLPAAEVSANKYYRLRRGQLAGSLNGTSDGIWIDMYPGPLASTYWEDINVKVWAAIGKATT